MDDFELVMDAVRWHEYGSQDARRAKALPALARIKVEVESLRAELEAVREQAGNDPDSAAYENGMRVGKRQADGEVKRLRVENKRLQAVLDGAPRLDNRSFSHTVRRGKPLPYPDEEGGE